MTTLTIKNIPDTIYQALKARAQAERRSLNSQLLYSLEQIFLPQAAAMPSTEQRLASIRQVRPDIPPLSVEDIQQAIDAGRP